MALIIENETTGERRVIEQCRTHGVYHLPRGWKAVTTVRNEMVKAARAAAAQEETKSATIH